MKFNREKYLNRINYSGRLDPDINTLRQLQKAHLLNVPFENLDIHLKTAIELDTDRIYEKIVINNRGGFCYELNGLFFELLNSLGFDVKRISARVHVEDDQFSPEYDHLTLVVTINGAEYLTDVGFGEFIFGPLKLEFDVPQKDPRGTYMVKKYDADHMVILRLENGDTKPEYMFKNMGRDLKEFGSRCQYHQSDQRSHFMKKRMISLPTEYGRITLSGNTLKIKQRDKTSEKNLVDEFEFKKALWDNFKISLD